MRLPVYLTPHSITAQITGIVTISVLLGMLFTVTIVLFFFEHAIPEDSPKSIASRIAHITRLAQAANSPGERNSIIESARRAGFQVTRVAMRDLDRLPPAGALSFSHKLTVQQLGAYPTIDVLERVRYPAGPIDQLSTKLDDQEALVFEAADTSLWQFILKPMAGALILVLIIVLLLSVYAVRWIIAPLGAVAKAAESFGRSPRDDQVISRRGPREITQVADALNEMRTRIRTLLDDRTRMLAAISHDLRTPLTRLRLRVERVGEAEARDAMLGDIIRISRMLDETLEYLRQDARSEDTSRIDLPSLLQTICSDFADVGHAVSYEGPGRHAWSCRPRALARALTNVVENGVKHATRVTVDLRVDRDGAAEISISDDGPGIPENLYGKVFEPFFKADDARNTGGSFGLGLSIARDIVVRHGGNISLIGREPTGLTVRVLLPAETSPGTKRNDRLGVTQGTEPMAS